MCPGEIAPVVCENGTLSTHFCHPPYINNVSHPDLKPISNITVKMDLFLAGLGDVCAPALRVFRISHLAEVF